MQLGRDTMRHAFATLVAGLALFVTAPANAQAPQKLRFQAGVELVDDRTIVSRADDWWSAWKQFFFAAN